MPEWSGSYHRRRSSSIGKSADDTAEAIWALMEARGWIRIQPGEGRRQLLSATQQGRRLLIEAVPAWRQGQQRVASLLGEQMATQLRQAVDLIRQEAPSG